MINREKMRTVRQALIVGIDVAKETHYAQFVDGLGEPLGKPFPFKNSIDGFEHLDRNIIRAKEELGVTEVVIGCEPTGHYYKPLAYWLEKRKYKLVMVGSYTVKQHKEDFDNSPRKNDAKDAGLIAELIAQGNYLSMIMPHSIFAELRGLVVIRREEHGHLNALLNNLEAILDEFFPEFSTVFKEKSGLTATWVLQNCPWPKLILEKPLEELVDQFKKVSKGRCGLKRAQMLQAAAARSIGVTEGLRAARHRLNLTLNEIQETRSHLEQIETEMAVALKTSGLSDSLLSIPGIGIVSAATFIGEIGDPDQYENWRQLQKLAGLDIVSSSSGRHQGKSRISHRGRAGLRSALYLMAVVSVVHNPAFRELYYYFLTRPEKPLCRKAALIAVSLKILRVLFHLAKTKQAYDGELVLGRARKAQFAQKAA